MSLVLCAALILIIGGGDLTSISEDDYDYSMPFVYRLLVKNIDDIPIGPDDFIGQKFYVEQRLVFASNLYCGDVSVTTEFEAGGIIDGDLTSDMVNHSKIARNHMYGWAVDRIFLRETYLKYSHQNFRITTGQRLTHWGIGMLINDGRNNSLLGDNYQGDTSLGLFLSLYPLGTLLRSDITERIQFNLGMGYIIRDNFSNINFGDEGYHITSSVLYDSENGMDLRDGFKVGFLYSKRFYKNYYDEESSLNIMDLYIKKEHYLYDNISSPNIYFFLEGAIITGEREKKSRGHLYISDQFSYGLIMRQGITDRDYNLYLDIGYASGDDDPFDKKDTVFRFSTEFKEGLILFPELYGFGSAASMLRSYQLLFYRDEAGIIPDLETYGSITNTVFTSINFTYQFAGLFRFISSILLAGVAEEIKDLYFTIQSGSLRNFYNSEITSSLLGFEIDAGIEREWYRNRYFRINSRLVYGHLFTGGALNNSNGNFDDFNILILKAAIEN